LVRPTFPFHTPPQLDGDPEAEALLEIGPVVRGDMGPTKVWLAASYQAVRQVLADDRFSREAATRPGGPVTTPVAADPLLLTSMEGERHARVRKLMTQAFTARMMERLQPRVQSIVDSLLDGLTSPADLVEGLAKPLPTMVICDLLGVPHDRAEDVRRWARQLLANTLTDDLRNAAHEAQAFLDELVREKRENPDDALISAMVAANDEGDHLTHDELLTNIQGVLAAGHHTTICKLGNSFVTLLRHPDQLQLLRDDPKLIGRAVEELLRYSRLFSSAQPRVTTEPVVLEGVPIGAGEPVLPVVTAANRDPEAFPDPHRFDITRHGPAPHLGFGHGPHFCLGAQLARMELRVALSTTIARLPDLRLAVAPEDLTYDPKQELRALEALPVTW
jgi:cytochrome P450